MRTHQSPDNAKFGFPRWDSTLGAVVSGSQAELDCNSQHFDRNELSEGRGLNVYNYMARVYDPQIGRWWSVDPLTQMQESVSGYQFCYNNPVSFTDPTGLISIYVDGVKMESHGDMVMAMGMAKSMYLAEGEDKDTGEKSRWLTNKKSRSTPDNSVPDNIRGNLLDEASKNYFVTYTSLSDIIYNLTGGNGLEGTAQSSGGLDGKDWFGIALGTAGTYFDTKGNALHNELYWKGKTTGKVYTTGMYGTKNFLKTRGGYANSYKVVGKAFQGAKSLGTKLGAAGLLVTGYDMAFGDGLTTSNVLDATFGAAGFIPGVGWIISGSYFLINTGVQLYSGKSIGEHLDE